MSTVTYYGSLTTQTIHKNVSILTIKEKIDKLDFCSVDKKELLSVKDIERVKTLATKCEMVLAIDITKNI